MVLIILKYYYDLTLQHFTTFYNLTYNILQHFATLHHSTTFYNIYNITYNILQHFTTFYNILQHFLAAGRREAKSWTCVEFLNLDILLLDEIGDCRKKWSHAKTIFWGALITPPQKIQCLPAQITVTGVHLVWYYKMYEKYYLPVQILRYRRFCINSYT